MKAQSCHGTPRWILSTVLLWSSLFLQTACGESSMSPLEVSDSHTLDLEMLAGEASVQFAALNSFRSEYLTLPSDGVSESRAVQIATAFVRSSLFPFEESLERQAGRQIDLEGLSASPRVVFAETPYHEPPQHHPTSSRAAVGPKYIVTFEDQLGPAVAVSVSAYVDEFEVDPEGKLVWPRSYGNQFRSVGINPGENRGAPMAPEQAVRAVFERTGARTIAPPMFVWRGAGFAPTIGRWRLRLDRAVSLEMSQGTKLTTDHVYVDGRGNTFAPSNQLRRTAVESTDGISAHPRSDLGVELVLGNLQPVEGAK